MAGQSASSYTVVARRYRPQTFRDLVGQGHIVTALSNAIQQSRVGHAYLFTGARGTGKTSSARIFAKCLNCQQGPTPDPCNQCDVCLSIAGGEDVDVLEFDGASNRGIDEIRQLRSNINIRPSRSRFKIYIIDEVHMLTKEAFNALLKTLEEPPEHVKFIFCTTDPQKLPITVLSRCQRYDFIPVATNEITQRLREIATGEGVQADEAALVLLARRAAGSMRDSQSLLEQVLAYCSERITVADVHALLGTADSGRIFELVGAMLEKRCGDALRCIQSAIADGCDAGQLANQLIGFFRDLLVSRVGGEPELLLSVDETDVERLRGLAQQVPTETLLSALQVLDQALVRMQSSMHSRTLLEAAVLRVSQLENLQSLVESLRLLQAGGSGSGLSRPSAGTTGGDDPKKKAELSLAVAASGDGNGAGPRADVVGLAAFGSPATVALPGGADANGGTETFDSGSGSDSASAPARPEPRPVTSEVAPDKVQVPLKPPANSASGAEPVANSELGKRPSVDGPRAVNAGLGNPEALWRKTLAELGDFTADVAADYRKVESLEPDTLTVTLSAEYQVQLCNRSERRQRVEDCLARIAGRRIRIDFIAAPVAPSAARRREPINRRQVIKRLEQHPLVKSMLGMFDGEVTDFELPKGYQPEPTGGEPPPSA
ncbi:MAG: DNA polymerase III subunit gamma/tau [Planctomycetota bacterium]